MKSSELPSFSTAGADLSSGAADAVASSMTINEGQAGRIWRCNMAIVLSMDFPASVRRATVGGHCRSGGTRQQCAARLFAGLRPHPLSPDSLFARQRDDAVPVFGGGAIVLRNKDREEILDLVVGGDAVQSLERLRPAPGQQIFQRPFVFRHVLVGQLRIFAGRW